jgi:hypothetical protein
VRVAYRRSMAETPGIRRAVRLLADQGAAIAHEAV